MATLDFSPEVEIQPFRACAAKKCNIAFIFYCACFVTLVFMWADVTSRYQSQIYWLCHYVGFRSCWCIEDLSRHIVNECV